MPFLFLFLFLLIPFNVGANQSLIYEAEIDGEIKAGTVQYVSRAINLAEENNADYLIINIDTPGGLIDSTKKISEAIMESTVDVVVFAHKQSGWVYSAGAFILLSGDYAFAHPESSIGASAPVTITGDKISDNDKTLLAMASWIKNIAETTNRNSEEAQKFVTENMTVSGLEAVELNLIDGTAENIEQVLQELGASDTEIITINSTIIEEIFDILSHPYLVSLFLSLGLLGIAFAFRTGEFEISGILGIIILAIGLWGMGVINFSVMGIIFLIIGIALLLIEFFANPGFGITGIIGLICITLGVFTFSAEPFLSPRVFDFATLLSLGILSSIFVLFVIIGNKSVKALMSLPVTGSEYLVGKIGEVVEKIDSQGGVIVEKELWSAVSKDKQVIKKGEKVKIISVKGNTLTVTSADKKVD